MSLCDPQIFEITLSDGWYRLSREVPTWKFSYPAATKGIPKLYTVSKGNSLLYVGVTKQSMASRLRYGFKANPKKGYHGYKWKILEDTLRLSVWAAKQNDVYISLREMETIEAEVAYTCRDQSGQWPTHQHEIHFFPSEPWHRDAAALIYKHATCVSHPEKNDTQMNS